MSRLSVSRSVRAVCRACGRGDVMASHAELVSELASMDKMPMSERLKVAKKRRAAQLKAYARYEKQLGKTTSRRGKKPSAAVRTSSGGGSGSGSGSARQLRFADSVLLLDATVRNDVDEGTSDLNCKA